MKKPDTVKVKVDVILDVDLSRSELAHALAQVILDETQVEDDAGCDWFTDNLGQTYIGNLDWRITGSPSVAALVDAMNYIKYGKLLKLEGGK